MQKTLKTTWIILLLITLISTGISVVAAAAGFAAITIVVFAVSKFILVGFNFMELKDAHGFWKFLFIFYSVLIALAFIILLK